LLSFGEKLKETKLTTELNVIVKGKVPGGLKKEIVHTLEECYQHFSPKTPEKVEVQIVDKVATMLDFLKEEKFRLGITTTGEEEFLCSHDAWRGFPRIIVCADRLAKLKKLVRTGAIRHEAAHSALHGSLEYYIFPVSEECHHLARINGVDPSILEQALYLISVAVKDFEATRYLVKHDYVKCQIAFALEILQPSEEDKQVWKLARTRRQTRYLCEVALIKPILFTHPLLSLNNPKKISLQQQVNLGRRVETMIEYIEESEQKRLFQIIHNIVDGLTDDTHRNVNFALCQSLELL